MSFFFHHVCHVCKTYKVDLKTCANCKLVYYCSVNHQRLHWQNHKQFCKCVHLMLKVKNLTHIFDCSVLNKKQSIEKQISWMCIFECKLERRLSLEEKQMILFPNVCGVCFIYCSSRVNRCEVCNIVNYCSSQHKKEDYEEHSKECSSLSLSFEIQNICTADVFNTEDILNEILKLTCHWNFSVDFDIDKFIKQNIPIDFKSQIFKKCNLNDNVFIAILSEILSGPLTILSSVHLSEVKNLNKIFSLKIHVIGANDYEMTYLIHSFEFFFHLLPLLTDLSILLVGPEVNECEYSPKLCEKCIKDKKLTIKVISNFYDVLAKTDEYEKPNLIVALNSGFHEYHDSNQDTWTNTVKLLLDIENIILIFTSYSKLEASSDFSLVIKNKDLSKIRVHQKELVNKFRSLRPIRDWEAESSSVFYQNYYISVLETFS